MEHTFVRPPLEEDAAPAMPPPPSLQDGAGIAIASASPDEPSSPRSPSPRSPSPPANDAAEGDFSPVLSKSAKRRQARRMNAWRAEEAVVMRTPVRLPPPSFRTAPDSAHMMVHHSSSPYRAANSYTADSSPALLALSEMFPDAGIDVLATLLASEGSFDAVVEFLLVQDSATTQEERQIKQAIDASSSPSPLMPAMDYLSALPTDLFHAIAGLLDVFSLSALCGVNREAQRQVEVTFAEVDALDLGKSRFLAWSDSRVLGMISRFNGLLQLSLRNTAFKNFDSLAGACFGRHLRALSLSGCVHLEDRHLMELLGLGEYLNSLDLGGTEVTDDGLEHVATARLNARLERIDLSECRFISTTGVLRLLDRCVGLRSLDLRGTNVSRGVLAFSSRNTLRELNLSACRKLPAEMAIVSRFCVLTSLSLSANTQLASVTLAIPSLTQLNLSNSPHVTSLALHTPSLQTLNLNGCLVLRTIGCVPSHADEFTLRLRNLNANGCRSISGHSFQQLIGSSRDTLTTLACRGCLLLNDANLDLLTLHDGQPAECFGFAAGGSRLESLDLSGCKAASPDAVRILQRQVAAARAARELADLHRAQRDAPAAMSFASRFETADAHRWIGGLDDDDAALDQSRSGSASPSVSENEETKLDA